jgi:hypothetical protein
MNRPYKRGGEGPCDTIGSDLVIGPGVVTRKTRLKDEDTP